MLLQRSPGLKTKKIFIRQSLGQIHSQSMNLEDREKRGGYIPDLDCLRE